MSGERSVVNYEHSRLKTHDSYYYLCKKNNGEESKGIAGSNDRTGFA